MATATAAYCMKCQDYVLVGAEGDCAYGHPRSYLRGVYVASVDVRTGRPIPPQMDRGFTSQGRPAAPVAPVAEMSPGMPPHQQATASSMASASTSRFGFSAAIDAIDRLISPPRGRHSARRGD